VIPRENPATQRRPRLASVLLRLASGAASVAVGILVSGIPRYGSSYTAGSATGRRAAAEYHAQLWRAIDAKEEPEQTGRALAWTMLVAMTCDMQRGRSGSLQRGRATYIIEATVIEDTWTDASYPPGHSAPYPGLVDIRSCTYMAPGREYSVRQDGVWSRGR
jgi:hypothetical protein